MKGSIVATPLERALEILRKRSGDCARSEEKGQSWWCISIPKAQAQLNMLVYLFPKQLRPASKKPSNTSFLRLYSSQKRN
ncbi:hypothetical protein VNO78_34977 [Psophocarpus tetragonolobus]|uniref:Uncharacterized protein n=1 Tax=Psophocarpus tetragonolobus TaxID=3891 RepID=A0AAN9NSI0_PSOTE